MGETIHDVIQVGYGPVGKAMAIMLGGQGRDVAIFERQSAIYPLPRAVAIDHEIRRILELIGCGEDVTRLLIPGKRYEWFNADWQKLIEYDLSLDSVSGGPMGYTFYQPAFEAALDRDARASGKVAVHLGWEATGLEQASDHVVLTVRERDTGTERQVRGRYLIGLDGANSMVRQAMGVGQLDLGFEADWLVVDVAINDGAKLDIPEIGQYCDPARPTTIVPAGIVDGQVYRRWEFMRLPHETLSELESIDKAWSLLEPWIKRSQGTLIRHAVYTFRSLVAESWRQGRVLLAGDSAHVQPPFRGQGLCSGLRDAWNLAWKLGMIFDGRASDRLLDSYTVERKPHIVDVTRESIFLGKIICVADPEEAKRRDRAFLSGAVGAPPPFPILTDGLLRRDGGGKPKAPAGELGVGGMVAYRGQRVRWDDVVRPGFQLVVLGAPAADGLGRERRDFLESIGTAEIRVLPQGSDDAEAIVDVDGKFQHYFALWGVAAVIVRPDFHLYGAAASPAELPALVDALRQDWARWR
jgi:2-polyprenyl-6-methoxyphenol hydroxylase-like FAD-dependent oxidoreductase